MVMSGDGTPFELKGPLVLLMLEELDIIEKKTLIILIFIVSRDSLYNHDVSVSNFQRVQSSR